MEITAALSAIINFVDSLLYNLIWSNFTTQEKYRNCDIESIVYYIIQLYNKYNINLNVPND